MTFAIIKSEAESTPLLCPNSANNININSWDSWDVQTLQESYLAHLNVTAKGT